MTVGEFYEKIGGDYQNAVNRFKSDVLIRKFVTMFLRDPSFSELNESLEKNDLETAFRAAHTLKGVCANLSFAKLCESSSQITEMLRDGNLCDAQIYFPLVKADYDLTIDALNLLQE